MAVGDAVTVIATVADGEYLDIRPPSGVEWIIHNIVHSASCELYKTDGTNYILVDSSTGNGGWLGFSFHVTHDVWYAVKNVSGANALISYDGIQSK